MDWTEPRITVLKQLWDAGDSARIIGLKLGVSKNAVIGKVHREGLQLRPSPIIRSGLPQYKEKRKPKFTRPAHSIRVSIIAPKGFKYRKTDRKCQWISGEPTKYDSCKCGAPAVMYPNNTRAPYCEKHVREAWRPASKRRI